MTRAIWLALTLWLLAPAASAHPLAPALLDLRETAPGHYDLLWRTSLVRARGSEVAPQWPDNCRAQLTETTPQADGSLMVRGSLQCEGGLTGRSLRVEGLAGSGINVIARIEHGEGAVRQTLLDATRPVWVVDELTQAAAVFPQYLELGVEHLLTGIDHVLFVLGLLLLVRGRRRLLLTVTAFTVGHSITLSLAVLDRVQLSPSLVELGIAISILLLAGELLRERPSILARSPGLMAAGFGLLHGLGFAGALAQVGLPQADIPLALLAFNLGIELGQLALVLAWLLAAWLLRSLALRARPVLLRQMPAYVIGSLAAYWCWERALDVL